MITITCDVCKAEDTTLNVDAMCHYTGTFTAASGFLVSVSFSAPPDVHICKSCLIDVLRNGEPHDDRSRNS